MTTPRRPPGTQAERTVLAWTRTSLSLLVGVIAVARLAAAVNLLLGLVLGLLAAPPVLSSLWTVNRRYHRHNGVFDGWMPALTAALAVFIGLSGLIAISWR